MKGRRAKKKESRVGLDVGTRLIKALEVSSENGTQTLEKLHFSEIDLPATPANTAKALKECFEVFQPATKDVNISLSAPSAIVRFINMPAMTEADLKNSLRFEAEKYIPFNINEVFIDASILERNVEEKSQIRVLLAAAKKEAVNSRLDVLKALGLSVSAIDIDGFACFNAFCNSREALDDSKSTALLNIGYTQTNVIISKGKSPYFTRDIQVGARAIAESISKNLGIQEKEADKLIFNPGDKAAGVTEASKAVLNNLIEELRLSFGYYENQYGKGIGEIYICGGVARLGGIFAYFEESFGIKPMPWNPFSKFKINPDLDAKLLGEINPQFGVAAGLAIRK